MRRFIQIQSETLYSENFDISKVALYYDGLVPGFSTTKNDLIDNIQKNYRNWLKNWYSITKRAQLKLIKFLNWFIVYDSRFDKKRLRILKKSDAITLS